MAQPPVIVPLRSPSRVIEGTKREIEAQLQEVEDNEILTLIIPGKLLKTPPAETPATKPHPGMTFAEILAPVQQDFEASGMTEEDLNEFIEQEVKAYRAEKRAKRQQTDG